MKIINDELNYCNSNLTHFETGEEFIDNQHAFTTDLDIFGSSSLFNRLSRSSDKVYKKNLAKILSETPKSEQVSIERQDILKDLSFRRIFRLEARLLMNKNDEKDKSSFNIWLKSDEYFTGLVWQIVRLFTLALSLAGIILSFKSGYFHLVMLLSIVLNLMILGLVSRKVNYYHNLISLSGGGIKAYLLLSRKIKSENFETAILMDLQRKATENEKNLKSLKSLINLLDQRLNGFIGLLLNVFFVFDLWTIRNLEEWKKNYRDMVQRYLEDIELFKVYETLSNYTDHHSSFTYPSFTDNLYFSAPELSHPFLSSEEVVSNNFKISPADHLFLVTGANMAGKSTFLRAVGLNWVMGMIGLPIFAKESQMKHVSLMTSMRINDSISKGDSYFKAEVERLKSIMNLVESTDTSIILLDEILRGTNSHDKRMGTIGFCSKLNKLGARGILATHDLEVANYFAEVEGFRNINFESYVKDSQLVFDYKLREGIAENTNASIIMKARGIID